MAMKKDVETLLKKEIALGKKPPKGTPKALATAWKEFLNGKYAKALAALRKVTQRGGEDAKVAEDTLEDFSKRIQAKIDRAQWMLKNGHFDPAEAHLKDLAKNLKGEQPFEQEIKALLDKLAAKELTPERKAAESLAKIEKKLNKVGFEKKIVSELKKFVTKQEGTLSAARASHLLTLAESM